MASKARKKPSLHDLSKQRLASTEDIYDFGKELGESSDRAGALLAAAFIDHELIDLLLTKMRILSEKESDDLFYGRDAILGTLSSKTRLAYVLGLITKEEKDSINRIREIRNAFAHSARRLSFENELVKNNIPEPYYSDYSNTKAAFINFCGDVLVKLMKRTSDLIEAKRLSIKAFLDSKKT